MHRVTLGMAIVIFIVQLFVAITCHEFFDETIWFTLGLNALFIIVPIIKIIIENILSKRDLKEKIESEKKVLEEVLHDNYLNDEEKVLKIISLAKEGNLCATLFLEKLRENIK